MLGSAIVLLCQKNDTCANILHILGSEKQTDPVEQSLVVF